MLGGTLLAIADTAARTAWSPQQLPVGIFTALLGVPAAVGLYLIAERRRMRYAITFTTLEVLAGLVGTQRTWRRHVPT